AMYMTSGLLSTTARSQIRPPMLAGPMQRGGRASRNLGSKAGRLPASVGHAVRKETKSSAAARRSSGARRTRRVMVRPQPPLLVALIVHASHTLGAGGVREPYPGTRIPRIHPLRKAGQGTNAKGRAQGPPGGQAKPCIFAPGPNTAG